MCVHVCVICSQFFLVLKCQPDFCQRGRNEASCASLSPHPFVFIILYCPRTVSACSCPRHVHLFFQCVIDLFSTSVCLCVSLKPLLRVPELLADLRHIKCYSRLQLLINRPRTKGCITFIFKWIIEQLCGFSVSSWAVVILVYLFWHTGFYCLILCMCKTCFSQRTLCMVNKTCSLS